MIKSNFQSGKMDLDSNKFVSQIPVSKIPSPSSPFKKSYSLRVRGQKANLSTSLPTQSVIHENSDYSNGKSFKSNLMPNHLTRSRVS